MLLKTKAIAAFTALSLSLTATAPAYALGKNERNVLKGIAAAVIVGAIVNEARKSQPAPAPQPVYRKPVHKQPVYQPPQQTYHPPAKTGRVIGKSSAYGSGVNNTTAAHVFNSYGPAQRVRIQRQLSRFGYYNGSIDGSFGPRTHQAVYEFARSAGKQDALNTAAGAHRVYNALLG